MSSSLTRRIPLGSSRPPDRLSGDEETLPLGARPSGSPRPASIPSLSEVDGARYELHDELSRGGQGRVIHATDLRLGRPVAIKELLVSDEDGRARFEREALITARLQHPSIVSVYDAGIRPTGEPFYAMRRVPGKSLGRAIAEANRLPDRIALLPRLIAAVDAVAYAHGAGIVHRDLKPENVMLGDYGETVVIDWGLAKDLQDAAEDRPSVLPTPDAAPAGLTQVGQIVGTPSCMSPEQARGLPVDRRTDVYALGATLYQLLAGETPYSGLSAREALLAVLAGPPAPIAEKAPDAPEELVAITRKAMAREPGDRYASAAELAQDLRRFQTGQLVGAHTYALQDYVRRFAARHRASLIASSIGLAAIVGLVVLDRHRLTLARDAAQAASTRWQAAEQRERERAEDLTLMQAKAELAHEPAASLRLLADLSPGSRHARAARVLAADALQRGGSSSSTRVRSSGIWGTLSDEGLLVERDDSSRIRVWRGSEECVLSDEAQVGGLAVSPGGTTVVSLGTDRIEAWDVASGRSAGALPVDMAGRVFARGNGLPVAVDGAGRRIAFANEKDLAVWDLATSGVSRASIPPEEEGRPFRAVAISDDGRHAACVQGGTLVLWDTTASRGRAVPIGRGGHSIAFVRGRPIAVAARDGSVMCVDAETGATRTIAAKIAAEAPVAVSPDGRAILLGARERGAILCGVDDLSPWDLDAPVPAAAVAFSHDGTLAAAADREGVRIWQLPDGAATTLPGRADAVAFSGNDRSIVAWRAGEAITTFAVPSLPAWRRGMGSPVVALAISPSASRVAAADGHGLLRVWDLRSGDIATSPCGGVVASLTFESEDRLVVAGADGRFLRLDGDSDPVLLDQGGGSRTTVAPGLRASASGGDLFVWEQAAASGRYLLREPGGEPLTAIAASARGDLLAAGRGAKVLLWARPFGEPRELQAPGRVVSLSVGAGGRGVAATASLADLHATGGRGAVAFWDMASGRLSVAATDAAEPRIRLSGNGEWLATFSPAGQTIEVWRIANMEKSVLSVAAGRVADATFTGDIVVSAHDDGAPEISDMASGEGRSIAFGDALRAVAATEEGVIAAGTAHGNLHVVSRDDLLADPAAIRPWVASRQRR
ncbi:MAG: serine/threonine-protein kinase [Acidobacteriota bacterium]